MKPLHYIGLAVVLLFGVYGLKVIHFRSTTVTRTLSAKHTQTTCEVHHVKLQKDVLPISYGLFDMPSFEYLNAHKTLFPHSSEHSYGGCVVEKYRYAEVLYCEQCRTAQEQWRSVAQIAPRSNTPPVPPMPPQPTPDPRLIAAGMRPATLDEIERANRRPAPGFSAPNF
jgi:hypothetical protein